MNIEFTSTPHATITSGDTSCASNPVNLAVTISTGHGFWTSSGTGTFVPNDTTLNAVYMPSAADDAAGGFGLLFTSTSNGGCRSTHDSIDVTLIPSPTAAYTSVPACPTFPVTFTDASTATGSVTGWNWNFGDGGTSAAQNPSHVYATGGPYNVTLTVATAQGCISSVTTTDLIDVYPAPTAGFSMSPNPASQTTPLVSFTDASIGATQWHWDFDYTYPIVNGLFTDTLQNTSFTYPDTGVYVVQQIVTNSYGCTDTAYNSVDIIPEYVLYAPNAFTPNNHDGLNDEFMPKGVGIDPDNFEMDIFDRWGNLIFKTTDVNKGWDGKANGGSQIAQMDVYVWKIRTKDTRGQNHSYMGHVSIVR